MDTRRGVSRLDGALGNKQVWRHTDYNTLNTVLYSDGDYNPMAPGTRNKLLLSRCDIFGTYWRPSVIRRPRNLCPPYPLSTSLPTGNF